MTPLEYQVDYSERYFIEGALQKGGLFEAIPEYRTMFDNLEKAKAAAISVLERYAVIRVVREELLFAPIFKPEDKVETTA